jgi:putative transposase
VALAQPEIRRIYLHVYEAMSKAKVGINKWMQYYNQRRRHLGLANQRPDDGYYNSINTGLKHSA